MNNHEYVMRINNDQFFFITGTSGAGKTTLVDTMQTLLSNNLFAIYDFDEKGVPENPDNVWRINTTRYWLEKSIEKQ